MLSHSIHRVPKDNFSTPANRPLIEVQNVVVSSQ